MKEGGKRGGNNLAQIKDRGRQARFEGTLKSLERGCNVKGKGEFGQIGRGGKDRIFPAGRGGKQIDLNTKWDHGNVLAVI